MATETTTTKKRVYSEGASNCRVFKYNRINETYADEAYAVEGLINVDITLSQTTEKKAADNKVNYLVRKAAPTGSGTIQFMGLKYADYVALYNDVTDANGVINFGSTATGIGLGIMYDEIEHYVDDDGETVSTATNRMVLYDCDISFPSITSNTVEEDNTDVREYELDITCSAIEKDGRFSVAALINSVDNPDEFEATETAMYVMPADTDVTLD